MVIEMQITPPSRLNGQKVYPNDLANGDTSRTYFRDQLATMKENLLNPVEVTFRVQENGTKRKRLTTISSEISDVESVASTTKKKIPVRKYNLVLIIFQSY
jgi:hypothetical protein